MERTMHSGGQPVKSMMSMTTMRAVMAMMMMMMAMTTMMMMMMMMMMIVRSMSEEVEWGRCPYYGHLSPIPLT